MFEVQTTGSMFPVFSNEEEMIQNWFDYLDVGKESTRKAYQKGIVNFNRWRVANGISNPTAENVTQWRNELSEDHTPKTVALYLTSVKLWFRFLEHKGMYPDVTKKIKPPKQEDTDRHLKDGLSLEQIKKLLGSIPRKTETQKRDYAMISLMITTGLRTVSVAEADIQDLTGFEEWKSDPEVTVFLHYRSKGKEKKTSVVKVTPQVCEALQDYFSSRKDVQPEQPLFTGSSRRIQGERLRSDSISRMIKTKLRNIGIDSARLTAHSLRHSAAEIALENGRSLREVQQLLDHRSITVTEIYVKDLDRKKSQSEQTIANSIFD